MEDLKHQELINYKFEQVFVRLDKIDDKLANNDSRYITRAEHEVVTGRIAELEDTNKWLNRLVIGAVIIALLSLVIITK